MHGGQFHGFVDFGGPHVEGTPEDVGKAQHIVDLVGVVGTPGGHDQVGPRGRGQLVADFRVGIGQGKHDGSGCHPPDVFGENAIGGRKSQKYVGTLHGFEQRIHGPVGGKLSSGIVEVGSVGAKNAAQIIHHDVFLPRSQGQVKFGAGNGGGARPVDHNVDFPDFFAHQFERVEQGRRSDDGGAVLVVVHHGNVHLAAERLLDHEALRGLDVFEVNGPEGGFQ